MQPRHDDGVTLTAFDERTATAVVTVLRKAGVVAWTTPGAIAADVEVRVGVADRDRAMRELGARMEQVRDEVVAAEERDAAGSARPSGPARGEDPAPLPDPDDVHAGPPLVMERFRSLRWLAAAVMAPLLVVTLAPTLRGSTARVVLGVLLAVAAVGLVVARRRR